MYSNSRGDSLSLDYSYSEISDIEQINATVQAYITNGWYAGGKVEHSISQDETALARGSLTYRAPCWAVKFETHTPPPTPLSSSFSVQPTLVRRWGSIFNLTCSGPHFKIHHVL